MMRVFNFSFFDGLIQSRPERLIPVNVSRRDIEDLDRRQLDIVRTCPDILGGIKIELPARRRS